VLACHPQYGLETSDCDLVCDMAQLMPFVALLLTHLRCILCIRSSDLLAVWIAVAVGECKLGTDWEPGLPGSQSTLVAIQMFIPN